MGQAARAAAKTCGPPSHAAQSCRWGSVGWWPAACPSRPSWAGACIAWISCSGAIRGLHVPGWSQSASEVNCEPSGAQSRLPARASWRCSAAASRVPVIVRERATRVPAACEPCSLGAPLGAECANRVPSAMSATAVVRGEFRARIRRSFATWPRRCFNPQPPGSKRTSLGEG